MGYFFLVLFFTFLRMEKEFIDCTTRSINFERSVGSSLVSKIFPFLLNGNEFVKKSSKINIILSVIIIAFYIYGSMMPTTLKVFKNNYRSHVEGDFLLYSKVISYILIVDCDTPTKILQSPAFYIFAVFSICYVIYFIIVIFFQKYLPNKYIQTFLFIFSDPIPSFSLFLNFANSYFGFSFYTKSMNIYKWMYLLPTLTFILSLPGMLLAASYSSFIVKHGHQLSIVSPRGFFVFIVGTNIIGAMKVILISTAFDNKFKILAAVLILANVSFKLTHDMITSPFACSSLKRIMFSTIWNTMTGNLIFSIFPITIENMSCKVYEILALIIAATAVIIAIITEKINVSKSKEFDPNDILVDENLTEGVFMKNLMYKDLYENYELTDEIISVIFNRWPFAHKLHFYALHLITTDKARKNTYQEIFTSLEQYCYSKKSIFDILHLLLIMEYASQNDENDTTSYSRRKFFGLVEKALDCQTYFWQFIVNGMPSAAATVYATVGKLAKDIEDHYAQLPEEQRKCDFYRVLYISFSSFISLDYKKIDNVYVDFTSNDTFSHCFQTKDDGTITCSIDSEGRERLTLNMRGRQYAERVFEHNEKLVSKEDVERCEAVNKEMSSFLRFEILASTGVFCVGLILALVFFGQFFVTYGKIISTKMYGFSTLADMYAFLDVILWTAFDGSSSSDVGKPFSDVYTKEFQDMKQSVHSAIGRIKDYQGETFVAHIEKMFSIAESMINESTIGETSLNDILKRDDYVQFCESLTLASCTVLNKTNDMVERFKDYVEKSDSFGSYFSIATHTYFVIGFFVIVFSCVSLYKKVSIITCQSFFVDRIILSQVYNQCSSSIFHKSKKTKLKEATSLPLEKITVIEIIVLYLLTSMAFMAFGVFEDNMLWKVFGLYYNCADTFSMPSLITPSLFDFGLYMNYENVSSLFISWIEYCYSNGVTILGDAKMLDDYDYRNETSMNISYSFHYIPWRNFLIAADDNISIRYKAKVKAFAESLFDSITIIHNERVYMPRTTLRRNYYGIYDTMEYLKELRYSKDWCKTFMHLSVGILSVLTLIVIILFVFAVIVPFSQFKKMCQLMRIIMVLPRSANFFYRDEKDRLRVRIKRPPFSTMQDKILESIPLSVCTTDHKNEIVFANFNALDTFGDTDSLSNIMKSGPLTEYTLPNGEKRIFSIERSLFGLEKSRTVINGSKIFVARDVTNLVNLSSLLKQKEKELDELKINTFPLSLYGMGNSCNFIDGMTVVDITFDHSKQITDDDFESFSYEAKVFAEQEYTFFTSNRTRWSLCFVFSTFDTLSIENQHYKDAIEFARNIMIVRDDIKIGIIKTKKAFIISNKTKCPGILILSAAPHIAHAMTKKQPFGSISVDATIIDNYVDEKEVDTEKYYRELSINGYQVEFCAFPNYWAFEEILL